MGTPLVYSTTSSAMTDVKDMQPSPMGTSPLDSTALPAMTDIEDTQLSPTETQSVNDSIPLSSVYKPEAKDEERGFHQQMTPPFCWLNPKPGSRRTCQPPRVIALLDWKVWLPLTATLVDKLANPPTLANSMESEGQEYPTWVKVLSSQKAATIGSVPYTHRQPQWCCNHSSKHYKRTQHLLEEEWWVLEDVSRSASSERFPRADALGQRG